MPVTNTLTKILTKFAFIEQLMLYYLNSDTAKFTMSVFNQVLLYVEMSGMANLVHFLIPIAFIPSVDMQVCIGYRLQF